MNYHYVILDLKKLDLIQKNKETIIFNSLEEIENFCVIRQLTLSDLKIITL